MRPEFGNKNHIRLRDLDIKPEMKKRLKGLVKCPYCESFDFKIKITDVLTDRYYLEFDCRNECEGRRFYFIYNGDAKFIRKIIQI